MEASTDTEANDTLRGSARDGVSENRDRPARALITVRDATHESGLARAVRADDAQQLAAQRFKHHSFEYFKAAIGAGQIRDVQGGCVRARARAARLSGLNECPAPA